jgi:hypothetical protein
LQKGYELLSKANRLIGHNIIGFDIPMVEKFGGIKLRDKEVIDTLVLSRLFNPTREGGHSLEKWGYKLGLSKINFEDYLNYSTEMLDYCVRDVQLNTLVYKSLRNESKGFSKQSIELEQDVARIIKQQEENGFMFDMESALVLLAELREKSQQIEDEVHNTFNPEAVFTSTTSPSITQSMCPLIPDTVISFCSLVTSCPDNLTRNKTISSSRCPYKNLINVVGEMTSVVSDSEFISYHNCLGCLPMLDIRKAGLPLGLGCDQV